VAKPVSTELVLIAWLGTIPGITPAMVDYALPGKTELWKDTGFITVGPAFGGGHEDPELPVRESLIEIQCYGVNPGTLNPNYQIASDLAELVVRACEEDHKCNEELVTRDGYRRARVTAVWVIRDPERILDEAASYGRYDLDLAVRWIEIPD
jgi:hypothetical protein